MFDFAWSEIALIAVVALIAIGPKDMPVAIRAVTGWIKKARRMAAEFQTHVDEMVREADLHEVRNSINEIRNFDIKSEIERSVDPDGSLRSTFSSNPLEPTPVVTPPPEPEPALEAPPSMPEPEPLPTAAVTVPQAPAFIPPNMVPPEELKPAAPEAPAFIPPNVAAQRQART